MRIRPHLRKAARKTPIWPLLRPRRTHVYGVGAPKTGTWSMAKLFSTNYRSAHQAHLIDTTSLLQQMERGAVNRRQVAQAVRQREWKRRLEYESAFYLAHFCDILANEFPRARFILTLREPRSWLRSVIDQCIKNPREKFLGDERLSRWITLRDMCFGSPPEVYDPCEAIFERHDLYSLDGFLSYWARHNRNVLRAVPPARLLVIRTRDISSSIDRIAAFAGVPRSSLDAGKSHAHKTPEDKKRGLLGEIDEDYLQKKITEHCSETMTLIERMTSISLQ